MSGSSQAKRQNIAKLVRYFHVLYVFMPVPIIYLLTLYPILVTNILVNYIAFLVVRVYWMDCPLTMLEEALRTGGEINSYRWGLLRKKMTYDNVCWWAFIQPVAVWSFFQVLGIFWYVLCKPNYSYVIIQLGS